MLFAKFFHHGEHKNELFVRFMRCLLSSIHPFEIKSGHIKFMMKRFNLLILFLLAANSYVFAAPSTCPLSISTCPLSISDNEMGVPADHGSVMVEPKTFAASKKINSDTFPQSLSKQNVLKSDKEFVYQINKPNNPSGDVIVLLHGSGGNEKSLMPFARSIWPHATLIGIRGRVMQKGEQRWYKKITATRFDQKDVKQESQALRYFLTKLADKHKLDTSRFTFIGYSNGANLLAVVLMQQPDLVQRAILLRSMPVLDQMPYSDLGNTNVLTLSGQKDQLYSPFASKLLSLLKSNGANVESHMVAADHMIGDLDKQFIVSWLDNRK